MRAALMILGAAALDLATDPAGSTPEVLGAFIRSELAKWGNLIKQLGIKPE